MALPNGAPLWVSLSHLLAFLVSGGDESAVRFRTLLYIAVQTHFEGVMTAVKTSTLTFRIDPSLKEALRLAAEQQHRSIANMVEVMIRDYCDRTGVPTQSTPTKLPKSAHPTARDKHL